MRALRDPDGLVDRLIALKLGTMVDSRVSVDGKTCLPRVYIVAKSCTVILQSGCLDVRVISLTLKLHYTTDMQITTIYLDMIFVYIISILVQ